MDKSTTTMQGIRSILLMCSALFLFFPLLYTYAESTISGEFFYDTSSKQYHYQDPRTNTLLSIGSKKELEKTVRIHARSLTPQQALHISFSSYTFPFKEKDSDADGLSDQFERFIGTNPKEKDSDGDGFPDIQELTHQFHPLKKRGARLAVDMQTLQRYRGSFFISKKSSGIAYISPRNDAIVFFPDTRAFVRYVIDNAIKRSESQTQQLIDESKISCSTDQDSFKQTGIIQCGHILWDLTPRSAQFFSGDPRPYLMKYDELYEFYTDFMARHEPEGKTITIKEDPDLAYPATADASKSTINVNPTFIQNHLAFPGTVHPNGISPSFMHEMGHIFGLNTSSQHVYIWRDMVEAHGNMIGILPYLMAYDGSLTMVSDFWCDKKLKTPWPCKAYFKNFEDYPEWLGANSDLLEYERENETFSTLFINPPANQNLYERGGKFQTMLTTLYSEYKQRGKAKNFYEAYKRTQQFYITNAALFPKELTESDYESRDSYYTIFKMNTYLLLLSVFMRDPLYEEFERRWRFPILSQTKTAYTHAAQADFNEQKMGDVFNAFFSLKR